MSAEGAGNPWLRPAAAASGPPTAADAGEPAAADGAASGRGAGRPRANEKRADGDRLPVRLTVAERARVESAAKAAGYGRVAPFVRAVLLAAVDGPPAEKSSSGEGQGADGRVLSNLNQIARALNTAALTGQPVPDELLRRTLAAVEAVAEQVGSR